MRYWLQLPQGGWVSTRENVRMYALLGEELGLDGAWLADHIAIPINYVSKYPYGDTHPVPSDRPFLEAYTTLAFVAGLTDRLRLAVTVAIGSYRHPVYHAKVVATLDHLSGGRLEVGIGTGWLKEEFAVLGADYTKRQEVTDEYLESMQQLWTGEPTLYQGNIVHFDAIQCLPRPVQTPHPPLWIGGTSKVAFRRMERFGAGWLAPDLPTEEFFALVAQHRSYYDTELEGERPGLSAKLWIARAAVNDPSSLTIAVGDKDSLGLLDRLSAAGVTDIRLDLSRLPSSQRFETLYGLTNFLKKEGYVNG